MCECLDILNKKLESHDARIALAFFIDGRPAAPLLQLERASDPGKKPLRKTPNVVASFCPFCGKRYPEPEKGDAGGGV